MRLPVVGLMLGIMLALPATAAPADLARRVDEILATPVKEGKFSGVVLVRQDGNVLVRRAYGLADRSAGTPNTPETRFMIFSVSKQFTAALILRLVASGQLSLDDPVSKYLEHWPSAWSPVRVRHLLSHSSGLDNDATYFWLVKHHPEYWRPEGDDVAPPPYVPGPLRADPGATYLYSNVGYTMLSMIASSAGGRPFDDLVREQVLRPLGMKATEPERDKRVARARGYRWRGGELTLSEQRTNGIVGAGDLVSTVDDLARWDAALDDDGFLPAEVRAEMFTPRVETGRARMGYGWFLRSGKEGRLVQYHTGGGSGFRAWNVRLPDHDATIVILSNVWVTDAPWADAVIEAIESSLQAAAPRS